MGMVQAAVPKKIKKMTNKEIINLNIGLTFDFLKDIVKNPSLIDKLPDKSVIEFVQKDISLHENISMKNVNKYIKVKHQFELL